MAQLIYGSAESIYNYLLESTRRTPTHTEKPFEEGAHHAVALHDQRERHGDGQLPVLADHGHQTDQALVALG